MSVVAIVKYKGEGFPPPASVKAMLREAFTLLGGIGDIAAPGKRLLLKPNLVAEVAPETGAVTHPVVVRALAELLREAGADPFVAEASAVGVDTEKAIQATGYQHLRDNGIEVLDLKSTEKVKVEIPNGKVARQVTTFRPVVEADAIINLPSLKTHDQAPVSLGLKNTKGLIDDADKRRLHMTGLFQGIADINSVLGAALTVVDGLIGHEGLGPVYGTPVPLNVLIAGKDPVAVDAVAARVMGVEPAAVDYIRLAAALGLGTLAESEITVVGEPVAAVCRRFVSSLDAVRSIQVPGGLDLRHDGACTGCRNTVFSVLKDTEMSGQLEKWIGHTVIAGAVPDLPPVDPAKLILVGNCLRCFRDRGQFVEGCPPNNRDVAGKLTGRSEAASYASRPEPESR